MKQDIVKHNDTARRDNTLRLVYFFIFLQIRIIGNLQHFLGLFWFNFTSMSEAIFLHFKFFVNSNDKKDVNKIFGKYQHHLIPDLLIFIQINEMPCTYMSG